MSIKLYGILLFVHMLHLVFPYWNSCEFHFIEYLHDILEFAIGFKLKLLRPLQLPSAIYNGNDMTNVHKKNDQQNTFQHQRGMRNCAGENQLGWQKRCIEIFNI